MPSYSEYRELFDLETDRQEGKIKYCRTYNAATDEIIVQMVDIKTGRFLVTQISYLEACHDCNIVVKKTLDLYRMLKEGASL